MPAVPDDLVSLPQVLEDHKHKPSRSWWDAQINNGTITAYKVPGERALFVSQAEVDRVLQPRPLERSGRAEDAV